MTCHMFNTNPLSEPLLAYAQLDCWEQLSMKFESKKMISIQENKYTY